MNQIISGGTRFNGHVIVAASVDRAMRDFLVQRSPKTVSKFFRRALSQMHPGTVAQAKAFFGAELDAILIKTAPVVDECEQYCPGIKSWLAQTGWANDFMMIRAFARWAEQPAPIG